MKKTLSLLLLSLLLLSSACTETVSDAKQETVQPRIYPDLPTSVWQAIDRHTIGHAQMTPLDMIVFVADGLEPIRRDVPAIHAVRELVDQRTSLDDVYWNSFYHGVSYVIETERYLYPGTLDIYNELALQRAQRD